MNVFLSLGLLLLTIVNTACGKEFPVQDILDMACRDTEVRYRWTQKKDAETAKELRFQEIGNTVFLKEIFSEFDVYENQDVPELDSSIIQLLLHSSDLEFQEEMLSKLSSACSLDSLAVLIDRVLLRKGQKQKYGTHLRHVNAKLVPYPIESPELVNTLRDSMGESTLEKHLEVMRGFDRAIQEKCDASLYKMIFNMIHNFHKNPDDYLYFASFEKISKPQEENGVYLAFEDPSLAAAFALLLTTPVNGDILFIGNDLLVSVSPNSVDDALILGETPIYMNVVEKSGFSVHETYGTDFLDRVYRCNELTEVISQFECKSALETLILSGSKIRISGMEMNYEYQDTLIRKKIYSMMYFDITLENESLE